MWTMPKARRAAIRDSWNVDPFSSDDQNGNDSSSGASDRSSWLTLDTFFDGFDSARSANTAPTLSPVAQPVDANVASGAFSPAVLSPAVLAPATSTGVSAGAVALGALAVAPSAAPADAIVSTPGSGLVFDNTWGSGVTPAYESCVVAAEKQLEGLFTNKVTLKMTFNLGATGGDHDLSTCSSIHCSYATLKAAIHKLAPDDVLPPSDPSKGKGFDIPEAYARMLGLTSSTPANDATITIDSAVAWDFGQDTVNAITHAITESAMGRDSGLGDWNGPGGGRTIGKGIWTAMDLFRYTAAGVYDSSDGRDGDPTFFSSDGGKQTSQSAGLEFANQFTGTTPVTGGNDPDDWTSSAVFGTTNPDVTLTLTPTEVAVMNALGWKTSLQPQFFTASSGDWETFSNWNNGYNPITVEDVEIGYYGTGASAATLSDVDADVTVNSISVNAHSSLTIDNSATLTATDGSVVNPTDTIGIIGGNFGTISVVDHSTLAIGDSFNNPGTLDIGGYGGGILDLVGDVTLSGGGAINLGGITIGFGADVVRGPGPNPNPGPPVADVSQGDIEGSAAMVNFDDTISGAGSISVVSLNNQEGGVIGATIAGYGLQIESSAISNEGEFFADAGATLYLDPTGPTASLVNNGRINLAAGADLEVTDNLTASGSGSINFNGAGAALTSDGLAPTSFTNDNAIIATASAQIGDESIKSVNDLMLIDHGAIIADGPGVTLTLNTGARTIADQGGLLEAENGAQLVLDSAVDTGVTGVLGGPNSGTIEAGANGVVTINAKVFDGIASPEISLPGQIVIDGGTLNVAAGVSIGVPITFTGASGTLNLTNTPGDVAVDGAGGAINLSSAQADVTGGAFTVNETGVRFADDRRQRRARRR